MSKVNPIPEGYNSVTVYLCLDGAAKAIDFYQSAFGATETMARITDGKGRVSHAEIRIGDTAVMLADEHPEIGFQSPTSLGASPVAFMLYVEDVDAAVQRAVVAGAELQRPVADQFYGDRSGEIVDPFGYRWTLSTHIEDVSDEEMQRRAAEFQKGS